MKKIYSLLFLLFPAGVLAQQQANTALRSLLAEKDQATLQQKLKDLGSGGEEDLNLLVQYYRNKGKAVQSDSVMNAAAIKYPKGQLAADKLIGELTMEKDFSKKEALLATFKKDFSTENPDRAYKAMVWGLGQDSKYAREAISYAEMVTGKDDRLLSDYMAVVKMAEIHPKLSMPFLKKELERFQGVLTEENAKPASQNKLVYLTMEYTYGEMLAKEGKYQLALPFIQSVYENTTKKQADQSALYARLLFKAGRYAEAFPILDELVRSGKGNPELRGALATSYVKLNPGKDGDSYTRDITAGLETTTTRDYLKHALNTPCPEVTLKDINGKNVTLADFKGKTVILDFWATWCGPCKKSFPAMQILVNKYKKDPNIKFVFIHTWETSSTPLQDAKTYLAVNHYNFDLYMDPRDKEGKPNSNLTVNSFKIKGIPEKYVIDGKGNIRFHLSGSEGGDDAAVEEMSQMIDYVIKNPSM